MSQHTDLQLSYVHGGGTQPLLGETLGACFDRIVERFGEREALVVRHQNIRWTYRELQRRANNLAVALLRLGLNPGERIGIWSQNNAEWLLVQLATAKAGLILVNINPAYRGSELQYALEQGAVPGADRLAALQVEQLPRNAAGARAGARSLQAGKAGCGRASLARAGDPAGRGTDRRNAELRRLARRRQRGTSSRGSSPSARRCSSMTRSTSSSRRARPAQPKGATLTHHNILNNGYFVGAAMHFSEIDRLCIPVPLYHCFGMVLGNLVCITHGATMVYPDESFNAESVLEAIEAERCTALHGVPTMFIAMLEHPGFAHYDLTSLRTGMMAGAPCPVELMQKVIERMHMRQVTIGYGMTETSPISFQSSMDDSLECRVSTVGRVQPHLEVKIVDEDGRIVPHGVTGELLTRGYSVMRGYWDDDERTRESIDAAGWMHSGDLATLDAQGYCRIVGRSKDMVIRGGENIYPREVEEFLYRHPKILDVQCVGVPDAKYGEELCACVILRPGMQSSEEEIREFCRGQIAHYKVPRYVKFVDSFPMTVTGKVQKFVLRQQVAA